jgi:hypothetical protein
MDINIQYKNTEQVSEKKIIKELLETHDKEKKHINNIILTLLFSILILFPSQFPIILITSLYLFVFNNLMEYAKKYYSVNNIQTIYNKENSSGKLYHDINGNVYLIIKYNDEEKYYSLNIDKYNDIEFYEINKSKLIKLNNPDNIEYDFIIETEFTSLKKKTLDSIENDIESDHEEEFQNYQQKIKYLNEDKYYCTEYKHLSDSDNETEKFSFSKRKNNDSILLLDKGIDVLANYDTYIRDNNKNVIASIVLNSENSYRISFYPNNSIELNTIGDNIKTYNLYYTYEYNYETDKNDVLILCHKIDQKENS